MMSCNVPTPNQHVVRSVPPSPAPKQDDSLASIAHMISLSPGIERPLCSDLPLQRSAMESGNGNSNGGSWRSGVNSMVTPPQSPMSTSSWSSVGTNHFVPSSPQHVRGQPVPVQGNVPIQHGFGNAATHSTGFVQHEKPPYSFPCLIGLALQSNKSGRMSVSQIYDFIMTHFPYFRTAKSGWKNSVRHNLSLNKFFCKLERRDDEAGKGSMWGIVPENREQLARDIAVCRNRYPTKTRSMSVGSHTMMHQMTQHQQQHMRFVPSSPAPKPQPPYPINRASSAPMIHVGGSLAMADFQPSLQPIMPSKRLSLPGDVGTLPIDFLDDVDMDMDDMNVDALLNADVPWMADATPCSLTPTSSCTESSSVGLDMIQEDAWQQYLPDDLSEYLGSGGDTTWLPQTIKMEC